MRARHALATALIGLAMAGMATPAFATPEPAEPFVLVVWCSSGEPTLPHVVAADPSSAPRADCGGPARSDRAWLHPGPDAVALLSPRALGVWSVPAAPVRDAAEP